MAPKSSILSHQQSEEEEDRDQSSSGEQSGDESDEAQQNNEENSYETEDVTDDEEHAQIPPLKSDSKSIPRENGSDSDPDSEDSPSDYKLQPIRKGSSSKRNREEDDSEILESSRDRKSSKIEDKKSASGGCINRLWSSDDEIAVLKGMIEFKTTNGVVPSADMARFHSFIKGTLKGDFSKDQLKSKIVRFKKRFLNALKKGSNEVSTKPHDALAFELSKKIWGGDSNKSVKKEIERVEKDVLLTEEESVGGGEEFWSKYPFLNLSFDMVKEALPNTMVPVAGKSLLEEKLSLMGDVKAKELNDKWRELRVEQIELSHKMFTLMNEQVRLALGKK